MELYLQSGWGMMELCCELCQECAQNTTILSPRDLTEEQLISLSARLNELGGQVLLDPQFYLPRADHHRLIAHSYWPEDYDTQGFNNGLRQEMIQALVELNGQLMTENIIVPGERAETIDDQWLESQAGFLEAARNASDKPLILTVCLSGDAVRSQEQINLFMEEAEQSAAFGYYLVLERPGFAYIVDDPIWLANSLDLAVGLRKLNSNVILGYSNHQQLIMSCAGANAIASGTWMNVRSFFPDKFRADYEEEIRRRTTWYYCPQALSEYKLAFLDIGFRLGLQEELLPDPPTTFAEPLFEVTQPSASGWREPEAFRHYLMALHKQIQASIFPTFEETIEHQRGLLSRAEAILEMFLENGVYSQSRSFVDAIDANRAALTVLDRTHGPFLRRNWSSLTN